MAPDEIVRKLRELRTTNGITLTVLADSAKVSPATITLVEHGYRNPTLDVLWRMATALNCTLTLTPNE